MSHSKTPLSHQSLPGLSKSAAAWHRFLAWPRVTLGRLACLWQPGPIRMAERVETLRSDLAQYKQTVTELRQSHEGLEHKVAERTDELELANERWQRELSRRRRIEDRLRLSEERYRLLAENSKDVISKHTPEGLFLYASPVCRSLLGYEPEEIVGQSLYEIVHPEDVDEVRLSIGTVLELPLIDTTSYRVRHKDGTYIWLETTSRAENGTEAEPARVIVAVSRNITSRKQVEAEILQRNRELLTLQSASAAVTSSLDVRHVLETVTWEMANLLGVTGCAIFEWKEAEDAISPMAEYGLGDEWTGPTACEDLSLDGCPVTRLVLADRHAQQLALDQDLSTSAEFADLRQTELKTLLMLPMVYQDRVVGLVQIMDGRAERNFAEEEIALAQLLANQAASAIENARLYNRARQEISERKRAEGALAEERSLLTQRVEERTAELSAANASLARAARLKDEFLAAMSHELRTPLNAVLGLSEALQEEIYGPLNDRQLNTLHTIEESGRHLLALINDILDVSKIEAGKLELNLGIVSVATLCQASLQFIKQEAQKKQISVSSDLDSRVTTLSVDERRLKQILVNLLSNAVKFTPDGGSVGLNVVGDAAHQTVKFVIWDTGIGIAEAELGRLFKPFVQVDSRLSRKYGGTGLGLALVYRMVEMHGGSVTVESEIGKGSRFTITLLWTDGPLPNQAPSRATADAPNLLPSPVFANGKTSVLLAENNEHSIAIISEHLRSNGYEVVVARNGLEAIGQARTAAPALVLVDTHLPELNGLEVIRRLRAVAPQQADSMPIVALTTLDLPGDREQYLIAGAHTYLQKPLSAKILDRLVHDHFHNGKIAARVLL
jgi:PAS domain S-box-containing protein